MPFLKIITAILVLLLAGLSAVAGPRSGDGWEKHALPDRARTAVLVYRPARLRGRALILLHGWKQRAAVWKNRTTVSKLAEKYGTVLVAPEMGTCNYMSAYYPETHPLMRRHTLPGALWMGRVLLPWVRMRFKPAQLFIAGVSTGARGAIVTAQIARGIKGAGYISGDWDIVRDNGILYRLSLGPRDLFLPRWEAEDTSRRARYLKGVRVFMAHSTNDRVTPAWQTSLMKRDLDRLGIPNRICLDSGGGHTWDYWNSRLPDMFRFLIGRP